MCFLSSLFHGPLCQSLKSYSSVSCPLPFPAGLTALTSLSKPGLWPGAPRFCWGQEERVTSWFSTFEGICSFVLPTRATGPDPSPAWGAQHDSSRASAPSPRKETGCHFRAVETSNGGGKAGAQGGNKEPRAASWDWDPESITFPDRLTEDSWHAAIIEKAPLYVS